MENKRNLFQCYEDFARNIYKETGCNESIKMILPKAHYDQLVNEMLEDPFLTPLDAFHKSVAQKYPVEFKILTGPLTFIITRNYIE